MRAGRRSRASARRIARQDANEATENVGCRTVGMKLTELSNEQLLSGLHAFVGQGRALLARLLAYLGEVEERRLDLESACSSLFDFCVRRLAMSEDEACRRVAAARLARRFPVVLDMIERGEIHLTGLLLLRDYLTDESTATGSSAPLSTSSAGGARRGHSSSSITDRRAPSAVRTMLRTSASDVARTTVSPPSAHSGVRTSRRRRPRRSFTRASAGTMTRGRRARSAGWDSRRPRFVERSRNSTSAGRARLGTSRRSCAKRSAF